MPKLIIDNQTGSDLDFKITVSTNQDSDLILTVGKLSTGNGKLTGQQLKALHCLEQLQAMLDDRLYPLVKQIAEADEEVLESILGYALDGINHEDASTQPVDYRKAISAMAIFCHSEIVERGLRSTP